MEEVEEGVAMVLSVNDEDTLEVAIVSDIVVTVAPEVVEGVVDVDDVLDVVVKV
jgi:hypothetical protein